MPGFESMKITLPNQKEIALSDLYKLQKLNPEKCALDSANLRGKSVLLQSSRPRFAD